MKTRARGETPNAPGHGGPKVRWVMPMGEAGGSINFQEGQGVTGYGINAGYTTGGGDYPGWGAGIGMNFDRDGNFTGGNVTGNITTDGPGEFDTRYGAGINFNGSGQYSGFNANVDFQRQVTDGEQKVDYNIGGGLTFNKDGSVDINTNWGITVGKPQKSWLYGVGTDVSNTWHIDDGKLQSANQNITMKIMMQTRADADKYVKQRKALLNAKVSLTQEEEAELEMLEQAELQTDSTKAMKIYLDKRVKNGELTQEEADRLLEDPKAWDDPDIKKKLLAAKIAQAKKDGKPINIEDLDDSREGFWEETFGGISDFAGGLFGFASDDSGYIDENGEFHPRTCFVAGTLVHTRAGLIPIEEVQVGDEVLATNPETNQQSYKKVLTKFVRKADRIYQLHYENGTVIETTWSHRFFIRNTGWIMAKDLRQGDVSVTSDGRGLRIDRVVVDAKYETVYNLEVEAEHNFFVSNDGVLVHNEPGEGYQQGMSMSSLDDIGGPNSLPCMIKGMTFGQAFSDANCGSYQDSGAEGSGKTATVVAGTGIATVACVGGGCAAIGAAGTGASATIGAWLTVNAPFVARLLGYAPQAGQAIVRNPISTHAAGQMARRGITGKMVQIAIRQGTKYFDMKHGTITHVIQTAGGRILQVATNPSTGKVTTTIIRSRFNPKTTMDGVSRYIPMN